VDGTVYAELPIVGWQEIDPADYGAPNPADLMDTSTGISTLFTATQDAEVGDSTRDGSEVLTTIDGTIPGADVQALFPSAGDDTFDVSYTLTDDNDIEAITVTGPFYGDADVTYDLDFDLDADSVEIEAP
jgi:lipoprotein LprG